LFLRMWWLPVPLGPLGLHDMGSVVLADVVAARSRWAPWIA